VTRDGRNYGYGEAKISRSQKRAMGGLWGWFWENFLVGVEVWRGAERRKIETGEKWPEETMSIGGGKPAV